MFEGQLIKQSHTQIRALAFLAMEILLEVSQKFKVFRVVRMKTGLVINDIIILLFIFS